MPTKHDPERATKFFHMIEWRNYVAYNDSVNMSEHSYFKQIEKLLLNDKATNFLEIKDLQFVVGLNFDPKTYGLLANKIRKKGRKGLLKESEKKTTDEDVTVYSFLDQTDTEYLVTIFDSDELFQNPRIIDVFNISGWSPRLNESGKSVSLISSVSSAEPFQAKVVGGNCQHWSLPR